MLVGTLLWFRQWLNQDMLLRQEVTVLEQPACFSDEGASQQSTDFTRERECCSEKPVQTMSQASCNKTSCQWSPSMNVSHKETTQLEQSVPITPVTATVQQVISFMERQF